MHARLTLLDGLTMEGTLHGASQSVSGEVVFATGMTGYPESLTDPSYRGQILVCTYPLIGNYGVPKDAFQKLESDRIQITALIVSTLSGDTSHWEAGQSLEAWCKEGGVPILSGVDTRALTEHLREKGNQVGKIEIETRGSGREGGMRIEQREKIEFDDPNLRNLCAEVSIKSPKTYKALASRQITPQPPLSGGLAGASPRGRPNRNMPRILFIDCGVKMTMIRELNRRGADVIRVPWDYDAFDGKFDFDALMVSNGPGDPTQCVQTIASVKEALKRQVPVVGICLGNQILALATGAKTYKLKYGHRGHNQPVMNLRTNRAFLTSQNHGFAVDKNSLKGGMEVWFENLNDGTVEGLFHPKKKVLSVQFHPEATPGPEDTNFVFDDFLKLL